MQDPQNQQQDQQPEQRGAPVMLPAKLAEHLKQSDVILFISSTAEGRAVVKPVVPAELYDPENNPAHMLAAVIVHELPNLQASANGDWTDADRYQALREFAMLAVTDKDRFEAINRGIQEYEEKHGVNLAAPNEPEAYDAYANFIADAVLVTHPDDESQQQRELVIPGTRIILPMR